MKKNIKINLAVLGALILFLPLFFFNLGNYGLTDWDEAWYADIARNIVYGGSLVSLRFNFAPFFDHPPLGFWLMALSAKVFGANEFAFRFPSAFFGLGSVFMAYLIGKNVKNYAVGISSALITVSSVWFVYRARTGNLDSILIFFYLTTFYMALCVVKKKARLWEYGVLGIVFGLTLLVKSLFGLSLLVPGIMLLIFYRKNISKIGILVVGLTSIIIVSPWLAFSYHEYGRAFIDKLIHIGLRNNSRINIDVQNVFRSNTFIYLQSAIRKWYWPALASIGISTFLVIKSRKRFDVLAIVSLVLFLGYSFLSNSDTSIWHLLPLIPFLAILVSYSGYELFKIFLPKPGLILVFGIAVISLYQIFVFKDEMQFQAKGQTEWANVAKEAQFRVEPLYLDGEDLLPTVVYYSHKPVHMVYWTPSKTNSLKKIVKYGKKPFLLLVLTSHLEGDKIASDSYRIIRSSGERNLVLVN